MSKYTTEIRLAACKEYFDGKLSRREICQKYGIHFSESKRTSILDEWIIRYQELGANAFIKPNGNRTYYSEEKIRIVEEYLEGKGSLQSIAAKYGIPSKEALRKWVLMYNANRLLKDYDPKREVYMAEARRKTTIEERKKIVEYCLSHNRDYKGTASLFDVSYSQVYSWVKKYDATGEDGLVDKRGHHKSNDEVDELERLRRENKRLKRQLEENDMLVQLLKKVKEFEGM
ncbi:helix-turn-helix domain-containing protein [Anaerosporobacter faecicola]|uniref:helix-turn-helix domain-containing protein n=1 Tax=Anaerosporobacter faecicola TaxID=2718714 RepID=UPI00143B8DE7|nr:helix-turn-helix domain-containing protein [Anaerosporobacter faecicola]